MTGAKISIFRICSDPDALASRRREIRVVLDGERSAFGEEEKIRARREERALQECIQLITESMKASLGWDW